jgi:hypothetical protein
MLPGSPLLVAALLLRRSSQLSSRSTKAHETGIAFIGSLAAGYVADIISRTWTITTGLSITCVGVALEFASTTVQVFFAGKFHQRIGSWDPNDNRLTLGY